MAVFNEPNQWEHTLGNNADISTLPDDAAATAGIASLQKLFQIINATPLEAGGIAPGREDVNALFKYLGDQIFYTQNGGIPSYNAAYDYIAGRVVLYNGNLYKCIQANGASSTVVAPDSDTAYWQGLDNYVRSVNGVTADNAGNVTIDTSPNKTPYLNIATDNLMETSPVLHGNITLSQSWRSFDALLVMLIDDDLSYMSPHVLDVKAFDKAISMMKALATGAGQKGVGLAAFGGLYWYIDPYTTTSYTFSLLREENSGIHSIYGCYYRMH